MLGWKCWFGKCWVIKRCSWKCLLVVSFVFFIFAGYIFFIDDESDEFYENPEYVPSVVVAAFPTMATRLREDPYFLKSIKVYHDAVGNGIIHWAAFHGQLDVLQFFYENDRQSLGTPGAQDFTAAHAAAQKGHLHIIKWIFSKNGSLLLCRSTRGITPIHSAAGQDHLAIVQFIHDNLPSSISLSDENGHTAVHTAAINSRTHVLDWLFDKKPSLFTRPDIHGRTPAHLAVINGRKSERVDSLRLLAARGVPLHAAAGDSEGLHLVHYAVVSERLDVLEWLRDTDPARLTDPTSPPPMRPCASPASLAAAGGHVKVLKWFAKAQPLLLVTRDCGGFTPLERAINQGEEKAARLLRRLVSGKWPSWLPLAAPDWLAGAFIDHGPTLAVTAAALLAAAAYLPGLLRRRSCRRPSPAAPTLAPTPALPIRCPRSGRRAAPAPAPTPTKPAAAAKAEVMPAAPAAAWLGFQATASDVVATVAAAAMEAWVRLRGCAVAAASAVWACRAASPFAIQGWGEQASPARSTTPARSAVAETSAASGGSSSAVAAMLAHVRGGKDDAGARSILEPAVANVDDVNASASEAVTDSPQGGTRRRKVAACAHCGAVRVGLSKCAGCVAGGGGGGGGGGAGREMARYCGRKCQMAHWPVHRRHCLGRDASSAASFSSGGGSGASVDADAVDVE